MTRSVRHAYIPAIDEQAQAPGAAYKHMRGGQLRLLAARARLPAPLYSPPRI